MSYESNTPPAASLLPWYALRVRSNFESTVASMLEARGFEGFLPTYTARRRWSDRVKEIQMPLLPGYVFCRLDIHNRLPVLTIPGMVSIVGIGKQPVAVDEHEIEAVRSIVRSRLQAQPWPYLRAGQSVRIERGPLAGLEGILVEFKSGYRLVVSVTLLQRSVAAEVEGDFVRPVAPRCGAPVGRERATAEEREDEHAIIRSHSRV